MLQAGFGKERARGGNATLATNFKLALTATVVSVGWITTFGKPSASSAADDRTASEQLFLANALGLMQGWAWADFVASAFKALTGEIGVARGSAEQVGASFSMTLVLTILLVGVRAYLVRRERRNSGAPAAKVPAKELH